MASVCNEWQAFSCWVQGLDSLVQMLDHSVQALDPSATTFLPWWRRQFPLSGHVLSKQMAHHWGTSLKFSSLFIMISFPSNGLILKSGCKDTTFFNWFHDLSHVGEILNSMVSDYQGVTRRKKLPCHSCHYWCHSENAVKQSHSRLCGMSGIKVVL